MAGQGQNVKMVGTLFLKKSIAYEKTNPVQNRFSFKLIFLSLEVIKVFMGWGHFSNWSLVGKTYHIHLKAHEKLM